MKELLTELEHVKAQNRTLRAKQESIARKHKVMLAKIEKIRGAIDLLYSELLQEIQADKLTAQDHTITQEQSTEQENRNAAI